MSLAFSAVTASTVMSRPSDKRRCVAIIALLVGLSFTTHSSALYNPANSDFSYWLRIARDWRQGARLYEEVWENKLPTILILVGLCDGPDPKLSCYLIEASLITLAGFVLYRSMLRVAPRSALVAAVLLIAWTGMAPTFCVGQSTEAPAVSFEVIAYSLVLASALRTSVPGAFVGGLCSFLAITLRLPFVLHLAGYVPLLLMAARRQGRRSCALLVGCWGAGFLFGLTALSVHATLYDYGRGLIGMLRENRAYVVDHAIAPIVSLWSFKDQMYRLVATHEVAVVLPCLTLAAAMVWRMRRNRSIRLDALGFSAVFWLIAALLGVFPGGRHFEHYYHGIWAPLAILSSLWLSRLSIVPGTRSLTRALSVGLVAGVALASVPLQGIRLLAVRVRGLDEDSARVLDAARYLQETSRSDEVVPVFVYGPWAELYWRVPRPPVADCVAPVLFAPHGLAAHQPDRFQRWLSSMIANPPRVVVVEDADLDPRPEPGRKPPDDHFCQWVELIRRDYDISRRFGNLLILQRRPEVTGSGP